MQRAWEDRRGKKQLLGRALSLLTPAPPFVRERRGHVLDDTCIQAEDEGSRSKTAQQLSRPRQAGKQLVRVVWQKLLALLEDLSSSDSKHRLRKDVASWSVKVLHKQVKLDERRRR